MLLKRLDAGEGAARADELAPVSIRRLTADVVDTVRAGLAQQYGVTIVWDQSGRLPDTIMGHKEYLEHILLSLVVYCAQASAGADGGGSVGVRLWCQKLVPLNAAAAAAAASDDRGVQRRLVLRVVAGRRVLSAEQLSVLFEPYAACFHDTQHDAGGGSGRLGLHVARRLAEALGGTLAVRSRDDGGTRLIAVLPVLTAQTEDCGSGSSTPREPDDAASRRASSDSCRSSVSDDFVLLRSAAAGAMAPHPAVGAQLQDDPGVQHYFPLTAADETERYEALKARGMLREMMDLLLVNSPDGFTVGEGASGVCHEQQPPLTLASIGPAGERYIYMSPGALKLLRFGSKEEAVG